MLINLAPDGFSDKKQPPHKIATTGDCVHLHAGLDAKQTHLSGKDYLVCPPRDHTFYTPSQLQLPRLSLTETHLTLSAAKCENLQKN